MTKPWYKREAGTLPCLVAITLAVGIILVLAATLERSL